MLKTALMFGSNMVIQQGKPFVIWGEATPNQRIEVSFQGKQGTCTSNKQGYWILKLDEPIISRQEDLLIHSGKEEIRYNNVAVGEVWLAGGQSNMEFYMRYETHYKKELSLTENTDIRFFDYPEVSYDEQFNEYNYDKFGFWRKCDGSNLEYFSAVGYYFAKELQANLNIPLGILGCNWGGTPACAWMSEDSVRKVGAEWMTDYEAEVKNLDLMAYKENLKKSIVNDRTNPFNGFNEMAMYEVPREKQMEIIASFGGMPTVGCGPMDSWRPTGLYENMLKKIAPFGIKGFIFYQGESDDPKAELYENMLTELIHDWRGLWKEELPFLNVQLAPFEKWLESDARNYPLLRQAQENVANKVSNTWLASIGDMGMRYDIHPKNKCAVGQRLAFLALNHVYGKTDISCDAPEVVSVSKRKKVIVILFKNVAQFRCYGEKIKALIIYSEGKELSETDYSIELGKNYLKIIGINEFSESLKINFAKTNYYHINLYNEAGIPVKPFSV